MIAATCGTLSLASCGNTATETSASTARTPETEALLEGLRAVSGEGIMYGHHDDTVYGTSWFADEGRSDVKEVCGDYPAIISFDLGKLELGSDTTLDRVRFDKIRAEAVAHYERGGMVSMSWHLRNPKTGGDSWDTSDSTVVASILPGGEFHGKFAGWLGLLADFLNSLQTADGVKVPVLFRPWHEHTGSWFWWGAKLCTPDDYKALWRMTVDTLRAKGVDNTLYAYSTGTEPRDTAQYLERYPGDDLVDLIGFDSYQFAADPAEFLETVERLTAIIDTVGTAHGKIIAVTETGYESIPDPNWWTGTLLPPLKKYPLAYVLTWRNASDKPGHFYGPYPGQASADDFVAFYNDPATLFLGDVNLYE